MAIVFWNQTHSYTKRGILFIFKNNVASVSPEPTGYISRLNSDEFTALDGSSRIFPYGNETVTVVQAAYSCHEFLCLPNHCELPASNVEESVHFVLPELTFSPEEAESSEWSLSGQKTKTAMNRGHMVVFETQTFT